LNAEEFGDALFKDAALDVLLRHRDGGPGMLTVGGFHNEP
jgi:hypothetical protein